MEEIGLVTVCEVNVVHYLSRVAFFKNVPSLPLNGDVLKLFSPSPSNFILIHTCTCYSSDIKNPDFIHFVLKDGLIAEFIFLTVPDILNCIILGQHIFV